MSKAKIVVIIISVSLLIWLSIYAPPFLSKTKLSLLGIFKPPLRIAQGISGRTRLFLASKLYSGCIRENAELKNRMAELAFQISKTKELESENKRLKELLDFKIQQPKKAIAARVIGRDFSLLSRTILIDRGKKDGIKIGSAVITKKGLIGKIVEAESNTSRAMLLKDPNFRLGVIIQRTREQGLFVGGLDDMAKVIYLSPNTQVEKGDAVISCPMSGIFPKGLLIGYLKDIAEEETALYKFATVDMAVDSFDAEEVLCTE